jgi:putative methionine-R-sulfoxide reductase with GAF domain
MQTESLRSVEAGSEAREPRREFDSSNVYNRMWRNWFMVIGVLVVTTIGLAVSIPPLLDISMSNPWIRPELILLAGLSMLVLLFVTYMTGQQREVLRIHRELTRLKQEADERIRRQTARIYALSSVGRLMGKISDLQHIFDYITNMCEQTFCCHRASLMLYDSETEELVVQSVSGDIQEGLIGVKQKIGEGPAGWAASHRQALLLGDAKDAEKYKGLEFKNPSLLSAMVVPIVTRDELVGVLNVSSNDPGIRYSDEDLLALCVFAENAGICIRHNEQAKMLRQMIQELRDGEQKKGRERSWSDDT